MSKRGRKKGLLYPQVKTKVLSTVRKYPGASTNEVADKAKVGWDTAKKYLRSLEKSKKVKGRKSGNRTVWI
jgi:predicted transcriptional regulator